MDRTPRQNKKKGSKPKKSTYQCQACQGYQKEPIVACDKCDQWYHFDCVGIKSIRKKDTWFCEKCKPNEGPTPSSTNIAAEADARRTTTPKNTRKVADRGDNDDYDERYGQSHRNDRTDQRQESTHRNQSEIRSIIQPQSHHSDNHSNHSSSVNNPSNRRELELKMIEEERKLAQQRDNDYLRKKYSILVNDKRRSICDSTDGREVRSKIQTKKWVEDHPLTNQSDVLEREGFCNRLDAMILGASSIIKPDIPPKVDNQPKYQNTSNWLRCEHCKMVGEEENFDACLLCYKQHHYACLDIIMIDEDTRYICAACKNYDRRNIERTVSQWSFPSVNKSTAKQGDSEQLHSKYSTHLPQRVRTTSGKTESGDLRRCNTCKSTIGQYGMKSCDICDEICHFTCMNLASVDNEVFWVCTKCKEAQVNPEERNVSEDNQNKDMKLSQNATSNANQVDKTKVTVTQPVNTQITTGASTTLTSAQIASRHVVTRDLPIFVGKPEQWPMFRSRFDNSTKLCGFSDSENLDRLQKCLKGNALEAVRSRLLTAESVPDIMSTLEMLYGRPELIVNSLMRKIRAEPPPKADKLNTLVDFALSVKNVCATLEQANLNAHLSNPALVQELVDKLPTNIKIEWAKHKASVADVTISTLAQFLYDLARVISTVTEPTVSQESKEDHKSKQNFQKRDGSQKNLNEAGSSHVYTHQTQYNRSESDKSRGNSYQNSTQCYICKKSCDNVEKCPVFIGYDIGKRWKGIHDHKLCRKCLRRHGKFCAQTKACGVNGCMFKHHALLHDDNKHTSEGSAQQVAVVHNSNIHFSVLRSVLLRIVPVTLHFNAKSLNTFAYQDDGSDITMIENSLVRMLEITGNVEPLCLLWTADMHRKEQNSLRIEVQISGQREFIDKFRIRDVRTVESLGLPVQTIDKEELSKCFPYLRGVPIIDYENAIPRMLIGSDNASLNVPLEIVEGNFNQPVACRSRIGWSLHGRTDDKNRQLTQQSVNVHRNKCPCQSEIDEETHQLVKGHFAVENFGVQINKNLPFCSKEEERALELLQKYTRRSGDRYETGLLWRYDEITLPDSYGMAYKRLLCLENHKSETIAVIEQTIKEYVNKGYAHKLTDEEIQDSQHSRIWYLPLFTVLYPKKPNKIRVVFDAAAKVNNVSLNSLLLKGPDLLTSLVNILRRFREKNVAASGDITEMFPQIKIRREDVNVQRFLWRNGDQTRKPDQYVLDRMTFGANCSPASAQFVKNKNAMEYEKQYPRAVEAIIKNHYVDDMLECQHTDEEMIQLIRQVKAIHSKAGFEIRKFLSNSTAVMKAVNETDQNSQPNLDMSFGTERVLGMWWNTKTDCFTYSLKFTKIDEEIVNRQRMPTKREILKILMSIFDPLGLLSHYLIHLKIILQDVWRSNLDWDEEILSNDIRNAWNDWFELLPNVEKVEIPRLYSSKLSPGTPESVELHVFVDASEKAYSAVAYLRVENQEGVDCILIGSKTRVTPLKYLSVPRKELQAALLGSRLLTSIGLAQTFRVERRQIWSDSSTVLSWLNSDNRKYHQFVAHRVGEIIENTNLDEWRWIPSKQNVADEATKWSQPPSFDSTSRWFSGPDFLKLPRNEWPSKVKVEPNTSEEMKVNYAHSYLIVPSLIVANNFSNWNKMHRAMAYVGRFTSMLRAKLRKQTVPSGPLTREELITAEVRLIRQAQFEDFTEEMVLLMRNKTRPTDKQKFVNPSSPLFKCTPYLDDDGVIRMHGRIDLANGISSCMKRPVILPRNNPITRLLVAYYHKMYHHRNHRTVYNEIRQKYYIPSLRVVLNSVRNECQRCNNKRAKAEPPQMADLPAARLAIGLRAFTFVGIDYFGPMYVVLGRRTEKRWGVLFVCLTTRAVHVEIAYHLDTQSCIMCVRNFINLRGCAQEIFSDQGTNLKGMDNTLKELVAQLDHQLIASEFTTCYTKWNFNPPASPHMGGAWESMVKSVKNCLYEILPTRHPTEDMLRSLILEVCNIVNSRPLTYVPLDHEDDEVITPNHFILGTSNGLKPFIDVDIDSPILRSKWMENQRLTDMFWQKFVKEFLPDLTRRTKWHQPVKPIQVGDIVLLVDGTNIRGQYPKARVLEIATGSNNQVRRAKIQFFSHTGTKLKQSVLWRPAVSLAKLDVHRQGSSLSDSRKERQTEGSVVNGRSNPANRYQISTGNDTARMNN